MAYPYGETEASSMNKNGGESSKRRGLEVMNTTNSEKQQDEGSEAS